MSPGGDIAPVEEHYITEGRQPLASGPCTCSSIHQPFGCEQGPSHPVSLFLVKQEWDSVHLGEPRGDMRSCRKACRAGAGPVITMHMLAADALCLATEMLTMKIYTHVSRVEKPPPHPNRGPPSALGSSHLYTPGRSLLPGGLGQQSLLVTYEGASPRPDWTS